MSAKASRRLVIDASVARSSGGKDATYPTSKHCRNFLIIMMETSHQLVMTPKISSEWNLHQSSFARKWRVGMVARKKVDYFVNTENDELSGKIKSIATKGKDLNTMLKDFHLIEAAIASDRSVISLDEIVRKLFSSVPVRRKLEGRLNFYYKKARFWVIIFMLGIIPFYHIHLIDG